VRKLAKSLAKSWQGGSEHGRRRRRRRRRRTILIKPNNPHLAGGEKRKKMRSENALGKNVTKCEKMGTKGS